MTRECRPVLRGSLLLLWLTLLQACGGGGDAPSLPPPANDIVTIRYLRAEPAYDGWGLHLWGDALAAGIATEWSRPRLPARIEGGAAVFEVPVAAPGRDLNFIAHNGDLKSPTLDMNMVPVDFGGVAWLVQDSVAAASGNVGTPYRSEDAARAALAALGNRAAALDLSAVPVIESGSSLPVDWSDAAAFAEIYVRAYSDSDGDGVGDLQGLIGKLDYLASLGVRGLWLMPITESADNDHGYAVEDYRAIESDYGTLSDFEQLLAEAHARGIAVVIDYVMNHSASTNPLFLDASTTSGNDKRDWFVWSDTKPEGWNTFAGDPWRNNGNGWYYGVFSALMPDFNLDNPAVVAYHKDNLRFWLNKGVDGFRFDAVGVLLESGPDGWEDAAANHALLAEIQAIVAGYGGRFMVCEAPSDPPAYAADTSCGRAFAFGVPGSIVDSVRNGAATPGLVAHLERGDADRMPLFLSNHDSFAGDRPWNQLGGDEAALRLAASAYLLLARNPFTYYGEEVGMANGAGLAGDHALRTPMSWSGDPTTAGFSLVPPFRSLSANSTTHNVAVEDGVPGSLLSHYRELLGLRSGWPVLGRGSLVVQSVGGDAALAATRADAGATAAIVINFGTDARTVTVATERASTAFEPVFGAEAPLLSDAAGLLPVTVPARAAVVYAARR